MSIFSLVFSLAPPSAFAGYFSQTNQDVTAYTASQNNSSGSSRYTHSGKIPAMGFAAVRKDSSNNPHVPFGTYVSLPQTVTIDGNNYYGFTVEDTGIASSQTYYAIDIWWGFCRTSAYTGSGATALGCAPTDSKIVSALAFGEKSWTLGFYTP